MKVRVLYESKPIRSIAVQCDKCGKWFDGRDIIDESCQKRNDVDLRFDYEIYSAQFTCPICGHTFGANAHQGYENVKIQEYNSTTEVYQDCLRKVEKWVQ